MCTLLFSGRGAVLSTGWTVGHDVPHAQEGNSSLVWGKSETLMVETACESFEKQTNK